VLRRIFGPRREKVGIVGEIGVNRSVIICSFHRILLGFLDIQRAFDKVWHQGLLYKLKKVMPSQLYFILKSYLSNRYFDIKVSKDETNYHPIQAGVHEGSVLGPFLYLIYTADNPITNETNMATFADDTAILALNQNPIVASENLQNHLNVLQQWLCKWKIKVNNNKSAQTMFTTRSTECPPVMLNDEPIPMKNEVKYLGLHLERRLTWKAHIKAKKQQLNIKTKQMNWLIGRKSQSSLENKPIWTCGIELWGCAKPSNIKILQTYQ
jgi:hypothetical protein